jgi:hypothetical protein
LVKSLPRAPQLALLDRGFQLLQPLLSLCDEGLDFASKPTEKLLATLNVVARLLHDFDHALELKLAARSGW